MGNKKHKNSKEELAAQKRRTHKNQVKKYQALIELQPNNPQRKSWENSLEYFKNN